MATGPAKARGGAGKQSSDARTKDAAVPNASTKPQATASSSARTVPGVDALAGRILYESAVTRADLDPDTRAIIDKQLGGLLPGQVVPPGGTAPERTLTPDDVNVLVRSAAVTAAGLDPAKTPLPLPRVLWTSGANRLLVDLARISATLGNGLIELTLGVACDQTGDATVSVTFVTGTPDRPTGGVTATESHPRGPEVVVQNWSEALVAFAWNIVLIVTSALTGAAATDPAGRPLITNALSVSPDALGVLPMGRFAYLSGRLTT